MKTTLDLPDELVKEIKLRALHDGKKLKDAVAELLRKGLGVTGAGAATIVKADKKTLARRAELTRKFVTGEWGVELEGYEAARHADRKSAAKKAKAWRK